jgi:hypothetical protein
MGGNDYWLNYCMCPCTAATPHTTHHSKESPKKKSLETTSSETNKALY